MIKDFSRYALFTTINIIAGYVLLWFITNELSKVEYAQFGWLSTIFAILVVFYNLGHRDALFKLASQNSPLLSQSITSSILCLLVMLAILLLVSVKYPLVLISGCGFLLLHLVNVVSAVHRGFGCYQKDAMAMPIYRSVWLILCIFFVGFFHSLSLETVFFFAFLSAFITFIAVDGYSIVVRYFSIKSAIFPLRNITIRHFFFIELITIFFLKIDLPILKLKQVNDVRVSEYFFAFQLFEAGILMLAPVSYLFFNRLIQVSSQEQKHRVALLSILIVIGIVIFGNLIWAWVGYWLLEYLFPKYVESFSLISLFLVILLPNSLSMLFAQALYSIHKEKIYIAIVIGGIFVLFIANTFGVAGSELLNVCGARFVAEGFICILLFLACLKFKDEIFSFQAQKAS